MWIFLIVSTLAWGIAEIFYKKGSLEKERYSHLKITILVGFFMGVYALIELFAGHVDLKSFPKNFVYYLPVAACYIVSMMCSYFGIRFIQESISDPIENSSGALVAILCAIFLKETFTLPAIAGIILVAIGIICIGIFDKKGKDERKTKLGKKLAIFSIAMPFCYMLLDAVGTFLDIFYTEDVESTILINVNEQNLEHTANCAYELTFFLIAIALFIFLKIKKEKLFSISSETENDNCNAIKRKWYSGILEQKWKILAAIFEVIGQATYLFALSSGGGIAAVILGAGTVIVSLLLSRIFLKEKLSVFQYVFILLIVGGIVALSI